MNIVVLGGGVAGISSAIALKQDNKTIALLNQNKKCNYTVFIGKKQVPGITSGVTKDNKMLIKFIPIWKHINIDDEVITSGMDKIFPYGIKVSSGNFIIALILQFVFKKYLT
jgi:cell shape-determining protein MreC